MSSLWTAGYVDDDAQADGLAIEHVIEAHFHADFLSGQLELAEATWTVTTATHSHTRDGPVTTPTARLS